MTLKPFCRTLPRTLPGVVVLLAACSINPQISPQARVYDQERFAPDAPFAQTLAAKPATACDAARRALMSQGYAIHSSEPMRLLARKFFKPASGTGVELAFDITCLATRTNSDESTVYVVAWQDEFVTKRNPIAASVGVPVVGSVSMPVATTEDALVKVGVETIQDKAFYERFFALLLASVEP